MNLTRYACLHLFKEKNNGGECPSLYIFSFYLWMCILLHQENSGEDITGAKNEMKCDNQAPENKSETEKSKPVTKKDGENTTPAKVVR